MKKTSVNLTAILFVLLSYGFTVQTAEAVVPLDLTNDQKLSLATTTSIGTVVRISDQGEAVEELVEASTSTTALLISGAGTDARNGVYLQTGSNDGRPCYNILGASTNCGMDSIFWSVNSWFITDESGSSFYRSYDNVAFPWLVTTWTDQDHGATPLPVATSVIRGTYDAGITVAGAGSTAVNGVYTLRSHNDGRSYYNKIGSANSTTLNALVWSNGWSLTNSAGTSFYTSSSDTATPINATGWTATGGSAPAPVFFRNDVASEANWITYTGEIDAVGFGKIFVDEAGNKAMNDAWWADYVSRNNIELTKSSSGVSSASLSTTTATSTDQVVIEVGVIISQFFTKDLKLGMIDSEVKLLQQHLNAFGFAVSATGAGSAGNESSYFGAKTKAALIKFQKANNIKPAVGYFGQITRNYFNSRI